MVTRGRYGFNGEESQSDVGCDECAKRFLAGKENGVKCGKNKMLIFNRDKKNKKNGSGKKK